MAVNNTKVFKVFQYRMMPTSEQSAILNGLLKQSCDLYNMMLGMRIEGHHRGHNVSFYEQSKELTHLRRHNDEYGAVWRKFHQGVIKRLDYAYRAFFRGVKEKKKIGFPKYQSIRKWKSLSIPCALVYRQGMVKIKGIGDIPLRKGRNIEGEIKNATIKKDVFGWRISITAEADSKVISEAKFDAVGLDMGVRDFITDNLGEKIANPQFLKKSLKHLRISQRAFARKTKGSRRWYKCKRRVAQTHFKVAERRRGYHYKVINDLLKKYDTIVLEDLKIRNMVKNHCLARAISDIGWSGFVTRLSCKAAEVGRKVIKVSPHNTSQMCSSCGEITPKKLSERTHKCEGCGLVLDRDHNAAINILHRAGISPPPHKVRKYPKLAASTSSLMIDGGVI